MRTYVHASIHESGCLHVQKCRCTYVGVHRTVNVHEMHIRTWIYTLYIPTQLNSSHFHLPSLPSLTHSHTLTPPLILSLSLFQSVPLLSLSLSFSPSSSPLFSSLSLSHSPYLPPLSLVLSPIKKQVLHCSQVFYLFMAFPPTFSSEAIATTYPTQCAYLGQRLPMLRHRRCFSCS